MTNIVLLQHGPQKGNCIAHICNKIARARQIWSSHTFSIIFQYYDTDSDYACGAIATYEALGYRVVPVATSDLFNPGFYNLNRHVYTVSTALKQADDGDLVIKLRNDQSVDFVKLFERLEREGFLNGNVTKILTTNCFTRKDRWYHPSDMFLCSSGHLLKQYYSLPFQEETHKDTVLRVTEMERAGVSQRRSMLAAPESQLFTHFLKKQRWDLKYTDEDSLESLRHYCVLINSWNIDFCSEEKRTPGIEAGGIILPQTNLSCRPFPGGPVEVILCYDEVDIQGGRRSIADILYRQLSKALFGFFFGVSFVGVVIQILRRIKYRLLSPFLNISRGTPFLVWSRIEKIFSWDFLPPSGSTGKVAAGCLDAVERNVVLLVFLPILLFVRKRR